jgi:hypothetical protein
MQAIFNVNDDHSINVKEKCKQAKIKSFTPQLTENGDKKLVYINFEHDIKILCNDTQVTNLDPAAALINYDKCSVSTKQQLFVSTSTSVRGQQTIHTDTEVKLIAVPNYDNIQKTS